MSDSRARARSRVQQVSYEELEDIRRREYGDMRTEVPRRDTPSQSLVRVPRGASRWSDDEDGHEVDRRRNRRPRGCPDRVARSMALDRSRRASSHHGRERRRYSTDNSDSDEQGAYRRRRDGRAGHPRDTRDTMATVEREIEQEFQDEAKKKAVIQQDGGYLWYSMKKREEANFLEKHFDSSYDGLIAGVAGAALGSITAARFGGQQHKTAKAVGGAVLGALAFNAAEAHWRVWTDVAAGVKEQGEEAKEGFKDVVEKAKRFVPHT